MYDFKDLDSKEFELLTRDLLQKELGLKLETFSIGKDQGIDCLHSIDNDFNIIVQCKHYAGSNFSVLFNKLKKGEFKKVKKLQPKRYILSTSLSLTLNNKQKILELFAGFIKNTSDIIDCNSLNNFLNDYSEIKKNHLKLWIRDPHYIEYLLNRQTHNKSKYKLKNIKNCLNIFVPTSSFLEAQAKLKDNNYVIITGYQGTGKTTLANMLSWTYINEDYDFIFITDVNEGWNLFDENKKQLFYYDDFLGSTRLETLKRNEDTELIEFINAIKNENDKKFILTSRDYILSDAEKKSEKFYRANFSIQRIQDNEFTNDIKKEIYKKHLLASTLPDDYKSELLKEKNLKSIVTHKNFSPRIIEYITNKDNLDAHGVCCVNCCKQLSKFLLDNPIELWRHPYSEVLDNTARAFIFTLHTFDGKYEKSPEVFEDAVRSALSIMFGETLTGEKFNDTLHFLDGFFINIDEDYSLTFKNPSIIDFLDYECDQNGLWDVLIDFSIFYDQLDWLYYERIDHSEENEWLEKLIIKCTNFQIYEKLSKEDIRENFFKLISLTNDLKSDVYDKYISVFLNYIIENKKVDIDDILEAFEYIEFWEMPKQSVTVGFFMDQCYKIFEKINNKITITIDECELAFGVIFKYMSQNTSGQDRRFDIELYNNRKNLIKIGKKYANFENPNSQHCFYIHEMLEHMTDI